jgi:hypothetical protein
MAHAYTPGLKVTQRTTVRKERRLPLPGETLAKKGQHLTGDDIVARTELPGSVQTLNVGGLLGVPPEDVLSLMVKNVGDGVEKDEVVARSKGLFGLFKSEVKAPVKGTIESVSSVTGQVILREPPDPVQIDAYIEADEVEVIPREGVVVEAEASLIQGIFGVGGEVRGEIKVVASSPDEVLSDAKIDESCRGKVIAVGALITHELIQKAIACGVKAIVAGGVEDATLRKFLGYDIGVAITGSERKGVTLVVTEGFGRMRMADKTFNLLKSLEGSKASVNGATQIRAGVIRPEVIVPQPTAKGVVKQDLSESGLDLGMAVRIIRQPRFGAIGKVTSLPVELQLVESEAKVRVLEVQFDTGEKILLPRANVEIIEG